MTIDVRKAMPPTKIDRATFESRYRSRFAYPAFDHLKSEIDALIAAAWAASRGSL